MSNNFSKVRAKCMEVIRGEPGILQSKLYSMHIGHRSNIALYISKLVYGGSFVRIWDDVMLTWRLYPKGKEPQPYHDNRVYKKSLYCRDISPIPKDAHGEKFRMAFDDYYKILYLDLKILGMAAAMMNYEM